MKIDPPTACVTFRENRLWAILHDALAHPAMAFSGYARWSVRFHDYTSRKAWPRNE